VESAGRWKKVDGQSRNPMLFNTAWSDHFLRFGATQIRSLRSDGGRVLRADPNPHSPMPAGIRECKNLFRIGSAPSGMSGALGLPPQFAGAPTRLGWFCRPTPMGVAEAFANGSAYKNGRLRCAPVLDRVSAMDGSGIP
jgi:hypothetical protein